MATLTMQEDLLIHGLVELVIRRHRRLLERHAQALRRGRHPGPVPSMDVVLDDIERWVRADVGDRATLDLVLGELRARLHRRLAEADGALPAGSGEAVWIQ